MPLAVFPIHRVNITITSTIAGEGRGRQCGRCCIRPGRVVHARQGLTKLGQRCCLREREIPAAPAAPAARHGFLHNYSYCVFTLVYSYCWQYWLCVCVCGGGGGSVDPRDDRGFGSVRPAGYVVHVANTGTQPYDIAPARPIARLRPHRVTKQILAAQVRAA